MSTPPTNREINEVLDKLEQPRWQSDAEKQGLPMTNLHDSGAPLLDRDAVLRRSYPTYVKEKK